MSLKEKIDTDLKAAMLGGDKETTSTLRGLKSSILNEEIASGSRENGLGEEDALNVLSKEAKKRQESAGLYKQGGNNERAEAELREKNIIEKYLPKQMGDGELQAIVETAIAETGATTAQQMGQVIGLVRQKTGSSADGARIATLVKEKLA